MTEDRGKTDILLALHRIEDRLQEIAEILKMAHKETVEAARKKVLGSSLRKSVYNLCDGNSSVSQIAKILGKSVQQISNIIAILVKAGLVKEVRRGKEKLYMKIR